MNTLILLPYCPLPVDTGSKREMWKHLKVLKELGGCRIISAATRPVGQGWTSDRRSEIESMGYGVSLREEAASRSAMQWLGIGFAAISKFFRLDKAFGHGNPYHRYAFPLEWWSESAQGADLVVINYSYWSWLPCSCPKVVILHDLLSTYMWGSEKRMITDLRSADLVLVISKDEERTLNEKGIRHTFWNPPEVESMDFPINDSIGCVGSANTFNIEGLRWMEQARNTAELKIHIYGTLAEYAFGANFVKIGPYKNVTDPYLDCGIILIPTAGGLGVQIKAIEALAAGRAIVARRGSMRGIPAGDGAWIEVDHPDEMLMAAHSLLIDNMRRESLGQRARDYYEKYLNSERIRMDLKDAYRRVVDSSVSPEPR